MYRKQYKLAQVQCISNVGHDRYLNMKDGCYTDSDGRTPLHLAVLSSRNWESLLSDAFLSGCDVNARDLFGKTAVHYAVEKEQIGCLERLIQKECNPNITTVDGITPLMLAAFKGDPAVMRILIKGGAKVNLADSTGETALHYLAGCTHKDCEPKVKSGVVISAYEEQNPILPSSKKNPEAIQILIAAKAELDHEDNLGRTALHWTAERNDSACADLLIEAGASLNLEDKEGSTPYVLAIKSNSPAVLQSLIKAGCDQTAIDGLMGTALALAAIKGHTPIVEILLLNGEDPDECGYFGMTPLMLCAYESHVSTVKTLLQMGADPNTIGRMGGSAIRASLMRISPSNEIARHEIIATLIRANVDVNMRNASKGYFKVPCTNGNNTPLSFAIGVGYISLIRMLLIAGAEIPDDEFAAWMESSNIHKFFNIAQLKAPISSWKHSPLSLKFICRAVIRKSIIGKMEISLQKLPVARRLQAFLNFEEFDEIYIERADVIEGASPGMIEMAGMTPCGLSALEGGRR